MAESYDRRKEDRRLDDIERRVARNAEDITEIKATLRYDVVRKSGPWAERFERLEGLVAKTVADLATKKEIDQALNKQTRSLKDSKESRFTRREKLIGIALAAALLGVDILHIFFG